jgi:tetratricopeptide (TPR) repeat protein
VLFVALAVFIVVALFMAFARSPSDRETVKAHDAGVAEVEPPPIAIVATATLTKTETVAAEPMAEPLHLKEMPPIAGPDAPEDVKEAERLLNAQRYPDAAKLLSQLRSSRPNDPAVWVLSGQLHVDSKGRLDLASEAANRALAIDPKFYRAWVLKGSVLQFLGKQKPAADAYRKAIQLEPEHPMSAELKTILEHMH